MRRREKEHREIKSIKGEDNQNIVNTFVSTIIQVLCQVRHYLVSKNVIAINFFMGKVFKRANFSFFLSMDKTTTKKIKKYINGLIYMKSSFFARDSISIGEEIKYIR